LRHVRDAVLGASLRAEPSAHVYVENIFSPDVYASILRLFPTDPQVFRRWANPGDGASRFANYSRREEIDLRSEALRLPGGQREFWIAMSELLCGADFARVLIERFGPYARRRFGSQLDEPSFVEDRLCGSMILNRHDPDYYLGPHTDRNEKVFTCLFYFPERDGLDHLGTTLYRPLERDFSCTGVAHHDPANFERGETMPYRPNSALIFARTDVMFHGVHALTAEELQGSRRRGIQMQFFVRNERPLEECKVTLWAALPATMRAGTELPVDFRLTNRSRTELISSFPYTTQIGYRWFDPDGKVVTPDGGVTFRPVDSALAAGETTGGVLRVVAPHASGRYTLRLSVVQDNVAWFDDLDPANGSVALVRVSDPEASEASEAGPDLAGINPDIVPDVHDVALGDRWFPLEHDGIGAFRWVDNDAVVHVAALKPLRHTLSLVVEPGPGVGAEPFELSARLGDGRQLGAAVISSRQLVSFPLPPESPSVFSIVLHADRGGRTSPNDPRVLNFRIFEVAVERVADVFPAWATPGEGFYPLERDGGSIFRWVNADAGISIQRAGSEELRFEAESGPGFGSKPFTLHVAGPDGSDIVTVEVASRTTVSVPLRKFAEPFVLTLRAEGGGLAIDGDPRTLNFRVFATADVAARGVTLPFGFAVPATAEVGGIGLRALVAAVAFGDRGTVAAMRAACGQDSPSFDRFVDGVALLLGGDWAAARTALASLDATSWRLPASILGALAFAAGGDLRAAIALRNRVSDDLRLTTTEAGYAVDVALLREATLRLQQAEAEDHAPALPLPIASPLRYVVSFPRSGTTLLLQFLAYAFATPTYTVYPAVDRYFSKRYHEIAPGHPVFVKDHVLHPEYLEHEILAPVRDGRIAIVSLARYLYAEGSHDFVRRGELADFISFVAAHMPYGFWSSHTRELLDARDGGARVRLIRYEQVLGNHQRLLALARELNGGAPPPREDEAGFSRFVASEKQRLRHLPQWLEGLPLPQDSFIPHDWSIGGETIDWQRAFDAPARLRFHELGGTEALIRLGYETDEGWWRRG
jgi:hypothetical protein